MGSAKSNPASVVAPAARTAHRYRIAALYALLLGGAALLLFYGLDQRLLWGDEAETATLARNITKFGVPKTSDGMNRITLYGAERDTNAQGLWTWSPWLQEYVAAASFAALGPTTWAARAPFALCGWLSVVLLGWVAYHVYRSHAIALAAIGLLATSDVFLLHARQCRYYSISVLGEVLFLYGVYQLLTRQRAGMWTTAGALALLFYSNYIIAAADLPILLAVAWTVSRRGDRREVFRVAAAVGGLLLAAAPWLVYARPWRQPGLVGDPLIPKAWHYLREFHFHILPLAVPALPLAAWLRFKFKARNPAAATRPARRSQQPSLSRSAAGETEFHHVQSWERHLLLLLPLYLGVVLIPPGAYLRYLVPLLAPACLLTAAWVLRYVGLRSLAIALLFLLALSNLVPLATAFPLRAGHSFTCPLYRFAHGVTHPERDRLSDVLAFFQREAGPGETLYSCDPEFPLIFYTQLRVIDSRFVQDTDQGELPDWLLSESVSGVREQAPLALPQPLQQFYSTISLPVHNSLRLGVVPDPDLYDCGPWPTRTFVIYKKRKTPEKAS